MITIAEYQTRRQTLAQRLPSHSVAVIPAAQEVLRNGDAHYRFRQRSDFYYFTGFQEPDAVLLIVAEPDAQVILFNRPRHLSEEQWQGKRLGQDDAPQVLGIDAAYPLDDLDSYLSTLLMGKQHIAYCVGQDEEWDQRILTAWQQTKQKVRSGVTAPEILIDLAPIIGEMRLFKSIAEIELMREASRITVAAHQRAMRACRDVRYEYELEAELLYEFMRQGCRSVAYDSIVAGGDNACTLHYTANDHALVPGELVLIDAGGEFQLYAADVTRTFPVNGQFSAEQRSIYELVLKAQKAGIAAIQPGTPWHSVQTIIVTVITQGLLALGILEGELQALIDTAAYKPFYMHNSGHWLGLDVHDCGRYRIDGEWRILEPGMVLTVEPGIYISKGMVGVEERWWGIGVRIEDDILVTAHGYENLTAALMVEIADIEAYMRG